jgi:hypothetical protein
MRNIHLHVRLPLAVDAAQEAKHAKLVGAELSALEGLQLRDEVVDVLGVGEFRQERLLAHRGTFLLASACYRAGGGRSRAPPP